MQNPESESAGRVVTYVPTADEVARFVAVNAVIHRLGLSDEEVAHAAVLRAGILAAHSVSEDDPERRSQELRRYLTHLECLIGWEAIQAADRHLREFLAVTEGAG